MPYTRFWYSLFCLPLTGERRQKVRTQTAFNARLVKQRRTRPGVPCSATQPFDRPRGSDP